MARVSLSQQLSELREYTARLEVELAAAKDTIRTLKQPAAPRVITPLASTFQQRSEAARQLCKRLGVACVTRQQVDHFLANT